MKLFLTSLLLATCVMTSMAMAQDHSGMGHQMKQETSATTKPDVTDHYADAMKTMHKDMMVTPTGDADVDFVRGMIPHHQGAIDMAKVLQKEGKDPELKKMAGEIISAQEKEIAFMKQWLARHDKAPQ